MTATFLCQPWIRPKLEKLSPSPISVDLGEHISIQAVLPDATLSILVKTPHEIMRDINTIDAQILSLRGRGEWCYLIVTGEVTCDKANYLVADKKPTRWAYTAWQNKMVSIQEIGVSVLITEGHALHFVLEGLAKRKRGPKRIKPPRDVLFQDAKMDLLTSIAGIGEERASQILNQTGSVAFALQALTDPTIKPPFGESVRKAARETLGLQPHEGFSIHEVIEEVI